MTTEITQNPMLLTGPKLKFVRALWWVLFLLYVLIKAMDIGPFWNYLQDGSVGAGAIILGWLYRGTLVLSSLIALILFLKKSDDWSVIPLTVMLFTWGSSSEPVTRQLIEFGLLNTSNLSEIALTMAHSVPLLVFDALSYLAVIGVFLSFPSGRWLSRRARTVFWVLLVFWIGLVLLSFTSWIAGLSDVLAYLISFLSYPLIFVSYVLPGTLLFRHYLRLPISAQRQQIKWIVVAFSTLIVACALIPVIILITLILALFSKINIASGAYLLGFPVPLARAVLVIAFTISLLRYKLWDIDLFVNRALVYVILTGILGVVGSISIALADYFLRQLIGDESSIWGVVVSALPITAAFNPLKNAVQSIIDRYFKPEEVDFTDTFLEFTPAVRERLTTEQVIQAVTTQVKKQLNVDYASIYLLDQANHLVPANLDPQSQPSDLSNLGVETLSPLQNGEIVVNEDGTPYSLLVPLVVPRARIPDFLGLIMLGKRLNNAGYSTEILGNLKNLGVDAGKTIFLSQINAQPKQKALA